MTMTFLPPTFSAVRRGPRDVATTNVFPLPDFFGGSIKGRATLRVWFDILVFIIRLLEM
jgi:hypothetical protein